MKPVALRPALLLFGLVGLVSTGVAQDDDPVALLQQMSEAVHGLDFRGTVVEIHGDEVETLKVSHRGGEDGARERMMALTGSLRELIRNHDRVRCTYSRGGGHDVDMRQIAARLHVTQIGEIEQLTGDHYELQFLGEDRVAGRTAAVVAIRPKDEFRYGFRFWIDRENGMPLRSDMHQPDGEAIEQVMFTEVTFPGRISDEELAPALEADNGEFASRHARYAGRGAHRSDSPPDLSLQGLPAGYRLVSIRDKSSDGNLPRHHLVVSDGLAQVSVFLEPDNDDHRAFEGESRMGSVSAVGIRQEGHRLTAVGEVPMESVRMIADSVNERLADIVAGDDAQ